jgi:superfamily II DNA helicase RecQ
MPFMICRNCDVYYEIVDEYLEKDIKTCQCGSSMKYYNKLEDYLNSNTNNRPLPIMTRLTADYESAISRIVLECILEIPIELGIKRLMLVLKGNNSPFIVKYKLNRLKTYGFLPNFREEQLRFIIDTLTNQGYIESEYLSQFEGSTLKCTDKGKKFLNSSENIEIGFIKKLMN